MESSQPAGPASRRRNGALALLTAAVFVAGAAVGLGLRPSVGKEPRDPRASPVEGGAVPPKQAVRHEPVSATRAAILDAIARAPVNGPEDVDRYLDTLFEQARRRGRVTALDIEPGVAVALNHSSDSSKVEAFTSRMLDLQQQLTGKTIEEPRSLHADSFHQAIQEIDASKEPSRRQFLIRQYLDRVAQLPPEEQPGRLDELNHLSTPQSSENGRVGSTPSR